MRPGGWKEDVTISAADQGKTDILHLWHEDLWKGTLGQIGVQDTEHAVETEST